MRFIVSKCKHVCIENILNSTFEHDLQSFELFPYTMDATDVMLQKAHKTIGTFEKVKPWFSKMHENYGYKIYFSVSPNAVSVILTLCRPGNSTEIAITEENLDSELRFTKKSSTWLQK